MLDAHIEEAASARQQQPHRIGDAVIAALADSLACADVVLVMQLLKQRQVEVGFAGEVVVEAAHAGARERHDVSDTCLGITFKHEHLTRCREQYRPRRGTAICGSPGIHLFSSHSLRASGNPLRGGRPGGEPST